MKPANNWILPIRQISPGISGAIPAFASDPIEPLLDVSRAAHLLGISVKTLRDWIQGRRIDYVKVGTRVMIRP